MLAKVLADKFRRTHYHNIKEWQTEHKVELSPETVYKVILRGIEPSVPTFITMAYHLGLTPKEISESCKKAGDDIFWRLISPLDMSSEDLSIVNLIHELKPDQKRLAVNLLKQLVGGNHV